MYKLIYVIFLTISFSFLGAKDFVIGNKSIIFNKTIEKINLIGNELYQKSQYSIYLSLSNKALAPSIKSHSKIIAKNINGFYNKKSILISLALDIQKVEILFSDKNININKDDILDNYIIPFLAGFDKNSLTSKYSAGFLNGYSQIAENIADSQNMILEHALYSESKTFFDNFRLFVYMVFFFIIFVFLYKKIKNK